MGKPTVCIVENKGTDQLRGNCKAEQRLCFRFMDSTIALLLKYKISSLQPSPVTVQPSLCQTWSEPKLLVFSHTGSNANEPLQKHLLLIRLLVENLFLAYWTARFKTDAKSSVMQAAITNVMPKRFIIKKMIILCCCTVWFVSNLIVSLT